MKNIILSVFFAFIGTMCLLFAGIVLVVGFVKTFSRAQQDCPKGMTCYPQGSKYERERKFDFIVIDSIGRRYRPVPCRCDEENHKGCGDLYRTSDCETVDSMSQKITIVYPDGTRKKRLFEVENFTPPCDWDIRPNFRLERIK